MWRASFQEVAWVRNLPRLSIQLRSALQASQHDLCTLWQCDITWTKTTEH